MKIFILYNTIYYVNVGIGHYVWSEVDGRIYSEVFSTIAWGRAVKI